MDLSDLERSRENIRKALTLRGKTSFEISLELSRNRTYLDDFLRGRKQSISTGFLQNLANSLEINRDVLSGFSEWSDEAVLLKRQIPVSIDAENAELDWQAETRQVEAITLGLTLAHGEHRQRALAELELARNRQKQAFKRLMSAEKTVFEVRREDSLERAYSEYSLSDYLSQFTDDVSTIFSYRIADNSLKKSDGEGIGRGDLVFIDTRDKEFMRGGMFAIEENGSTYVRRVEFIRNQLNPTLRCKANNPDYPDYDVELSLVVIIGRVIAHLHAV